MGEGHKSEDRSNIKARSSLFFSFREDSLLARSSSCSFIDYKIYHSREEEALASVTPVACFSVLKKRQATLGIEIGLFELVENSFGPLLCRGRRKSKIPFEEGQFTQYY